MELRSRSRGGQQNSTNTQRIEWDSKWHYYSNNDRASGIEEMRRKKSQIQSLTARKKETASDGRPKPFSAQSLQALEDLQAEWGYCKKYFTWPC